MAWLAVYARPQSEAAVAKRLRDFVPVFYPYVKEKKRVHLKGGRSRIREAERPYFPRYLFAGDPRHLYDIRETNGVSAVVSCQGAPLLIPDSVIEGLRSLADESGCIGKADLTKPPLPKVSLGQQVQLRWPDHFLDGFIGEVTSIARLASHRELAVLVRMLGALREVCVPASRVEVTPGYNAGFCAATA